MEIYNYIQRFFPNQVMEGQSERLAQWQGWYKGYLKSFHDYKIFTGQEYINLRKKSLNIAKKSCEDWANLLLNEKCSVTVKDQELLDDIFKKNNFWDRGNNLIELTFALSMGAFVESLQNVSVTEEGEIIKTSDATAKIDYINATNIYPITFKDGELVECAFASQGTNITNISIHKLNEKDEYDVINCELTTNKTGTILDEKVTTFKTQRKKPLYQILKPNIANNIDINSPLGISIFANSINTLQAIDNAYDSFDTEIQYGRRRIFVDDRMINIDLNGQIQSAFDPNDAVIYRLPKSVTDESKRLIEEMASPLRTNDIAMALQEQLNVYSANVGFGKNYYTFGASGGGRPIQTATGIIAQNSDLFRSIKKHEILLERNIIDLVETIAYLLNTFTLTKFEIGDEVVVQFDDSIIEDTESQKASDRTDVANGVMSKVEYRMKWYGETGEEAKKKLEEFGLNDLDVRLNSMIAPLESGIITPELLVENSYKDLDESQKKTLIEYIKLELAKKNELLNFDNINLTDGE